MSDIVPAILIISVLVVLLARVNTLIGIGREILHNQSDIIGRNRKDTALLHRIADKIGVDHE